MLQLMFRIHADCATDDASAQALQQRLLQALAPWNATRRFAPEHSERFPGRCNFSFDLPFVPGAFAAITAIGDTGWDHSSNDTNDDGGPVRASVWNRHDEPRTLILPEVAWAEPLYYDTEWERWHDLR